MTKSIKSYFSFKRKKKKGTIIKKGQIIRREKIIANLVLLVIHSDKRWFLQKKMILIGSI